MNQSVRDFKLIVDSGSALFVKMSEMFFNILVFCVLEVKKCQRIDLCVKMAENQCENVRILQSSSGSTKLFSDIFTFLVQFSDILTLF